jgi:hypothetical protein
VNPPTPDPEFSTPESPPALHSIPHIKSPQKIEDKNLYLTPVRYENSIESDTCEGGGVQNPPESEKNNNTEKPPVTVWTEK